MFNEKSWTGKGFWINFFEDLPWGPKPNNKPKVFKQYNATFLIFILAVETDVLISDYEVNLVPFAISTPPLPVRASLREPLTLQYLFFLTINRIIAQTVIRWANVNIFVAIIKKYLHLANSDKAVNRTLEVGEVIHTLAVTLLCAVAQKSVQAHLHNIIQIM